MTKSMIEIAYDILKEKNHELAFEDLLAVVGETMGITNQDILLKKAGSFYSDLILDGRFLIRPHNVWDLAERYTSTEAQEEKDSLADATDEVEGDDAKELGEETDEQPVIISTDDDEDNGDKKGIALKEDLYKDDEN